MQQTLEDQLTDDLTDEQWARPGSQYGTYPTDPPAPGADDFPGDKPPADGQQSSTPLPYNYGRMAGYDEGKFKDLTHKSGKYEIGRTLSLYNPQSGITPEALAALNKLGYGTFSGSGQKLSLQGLTDAGRAAKIQQDFTDEDWIQGYQGGANPNAHWQDSWGLDPAQPAATTNPISMALAARSKGGNITGGVSSVSSGGIAPSMAANSSYPAGGWTPEQEAAAGIQDQGNNMVFVPSYGGMVDRNNPIYLQAMQQANPQQAGGGAGGAAPGGVDTSLEGMLKKLLEDQAAQKSERDAFSQKIHGSILQGIDENSKPVDDNDPIIAQQMRARQGEADRALSAGREAMAARAGQSGMPTGAFDASLQSSYENVGNEMGSAHAGLLADRYKDKLSQLMSLRSQGAGVMSADEQASLNAQITAIKARLDDAQLKSSSQLGNRDIDMRGQIASMQDALERARMGQDDNHFYDTLGFNIGDREAMLNAMLMQQMHGG